MARGAEDVEHLSDEELKRWGSAGRYPPVVVSKLRDLRTKLQARERDDGHCFLGFA